MALKSICRTSSQQPNDSGTFRLRVKVHRPVLIKDAVLRSYSPLFLRLASDFLQTLEECCITLQLPYYLNLIVSAVSIKVSLEKSLQIAILTENCEV